MWFDLPPGFFDRIGAVAVALFVCWMIGTGRLVTRREVDALRKDRDEWQSAYRASEVERNLSARQVSEMLEHSKVSEAVLGALSEIAHREK